LRKRSKPYAKDEEENVIVWIYDNVHIDHAVEKVSLSILIEDKVDAESVIAYPEKDFYHMKEYKNFNLFKWLNKDLKENSFRNFVINVPIFNRGTKDMVYL
jgi:hypothetical protein